MRWPLRYQILIPFALVLLGVICAVSVLNAWLATQRARNQIEEQLQGIAATLADSSFPLTDMVLRQMHGLSGAEFVFTDSTGHALATSRGLELPPGETPTVVENWQQLRLGPPITIGDQHFFEMVLSIHSRGQQPTGRLHIFYPEKFWQEARSEAAVPPLVVGAIALLVTAVLALWIAARLTRPILELRSQVSRIAQADYSPMLLPERNDELHDLAVDVNRLAEQLAEMERAIRRSERLALLGQLAGGLAHHLRNNVTGALMAVQLHARECNADPESLDVALRQLALTEENLKQFLAAPQNPAMKPAIHRISCRLPDVIREVVELLDPSLRHRRVQLSVVEQTAADAPLEADPAQLRQLLMNLVLNAADAAGPGGQVRIETQRTDSICPSNEAAFHETLSPCGRVQGEGYVESAQRMSRVESASAVEPPATSIVLRVLDNGAGPPRETIDRLFEPFATSKPEGVGLGLAVAQQIAQSHGGRIVFHRAAGETCFELHLPLRLTKANAIGEFSGV